MGKCRSKRCSTGSTSTGGSSSSRNTPPGNRSTNWQPHANGRGRVPAVQTTWIALDSLEGGIAGYSEPGGKGGARGRYWVVLECEGRNIRYLPEADQVRAFGRFESFLTGLEFQLQFISHTEQVHVAQLQAPARPEAGALRARTDAPAGLATAGEYRVPGAPPASTAPSRGTLWWSRPRREKKPPGKLLDQRLAGCSRSSGSCFPDQSGWRSRASRCSTSCVFASRWSKRCCSSSKCGRGCSTMPISSSSSPPASPLAPRFRRLHLNVLANLQMRLSHWQAMQRHRPQGHTR